MANLNPSPNPQYSSSTSSASNNSMSPSPFTYDNASYQRLLSQRPKSPSPFHYDRPSIQRRLAQARGATTPAPAAEGGMGSGLKGGDSFGMEQSEGDGGMRMNGMKGVMGRNGTMGGMGDDGKGNGGDERKGEKEEHFPFEEPDRTMTIRLAPLRPALEALDREYEKKDHPILDGNRMVGMGIVEAEVGKEELRFQDANDVLRDHCKARLPYVQLASNRLQAIMGEKNELVFDLPLIEKSLPSPQFKSVFDSQAGIGPGLGPGLDAARNIIKPDRKDTGVDFNGGGGGGAMMSTGEKLVEELKAITKSKFTKSNWKLVDDKDQSFDKAKIFDKGKGLDDNIPGNSKSVGGSKPLDTYMSVYNTTSGGSQPVGNSSPIDNTSSASNSKSFDNNLQSPPSQSGFFQVDPETGKGLREWLLRVGKENGTLKKRACKSISFHDFTADMKTGAFSNVLVSHYNDEGPRQRVDAYEVDLPTPYINRDTGHQTVTMQTWIWFFISRPILSFNPSARPPVAKPESDPRNWCDSPEVFYTPYSNARDLPHSPPEIKPPPNFPDPIVVSWMVFACPLANVTVYPEQIEKSLPSSDPSQSAPPSSLSDPILRRPSPAHPPAKRSNPFTNSGKGTEVHKRLDYDISHQGLPLFEFSNSSADLFPFNPLFANSYKNGQYLSVENMPPFSLSPSQPLSAGAIANPFSELDPHGKGVDFELKSKNDFRLDVDFWEHRGRGAAVPGLGPTDEELKSDEVDCRQRQEEFPCPFWGEWWGEFYAKIYEDEARWRRIKKAMGRGKCRVVIRWVEWDGEDKGEGSKEKKGFVPRGLLGRGASFGGSSGLQGRMRTVAHKRSRSALSVMVPPTTSTSHAIGVGRPVNAISDGQGTCAAITQEEHDDDEKNYWDD